MFAYHGTDNRFLVFNDDILGNSTGDPNTVLGHFFTNTISEAKLYGETIIEASLVMNKSYDATMDELVSLDIDDYVTMRDELINSGFDSIIAPHDTGNGLWYVIFSANQVIINSIFN